MSSSEHVDLMNRLARIRVRLERILRELRGAKGMNGRIETNMVSTPSTRAQAVRLALERGHPVDSVGVLKDLELDLSDAADYLRYLTEVVGVRIPTGAEWSRWIRETKAKRLQKRIHELFAEVRRG